MNTATTAIKNNIVAQLLDFKTQVRNQVLEVVGSGMLLAGEWVVQQDVLEAFSGIEVAYTDKGVRVYIGASPGISDNLVELFGRVMVDSMQDGFTGKNFIARVSESYLRELGEAYVV